MTLLREVFAAEQTAVSSSVVKPNIGINSIADLFGWVINVVMGIGIGLSVIFLIIGGIQYITSRGDQKAAETARGTLTNAVIGLIIVLGAFTIKTIVLGAMGADNSVNINGVTNGL